MPPETPSRIRATNGLCRVGLRPAIRRYLFALVLVRDLALGDLLEGHRQVVLRARLDERRQHLSERPLTELVVVVVDLPRPLRRDDHERVPRVHVAEELVDARVDHGRLMVAASSSSRRTIDSSSPAARSGSSFSTT